jgi:hypothetical protein
LQYGEKSGAANSLYVRSLSAFLRIDGRATFWMERYGPQEMADGGTPASFRPPPTTIVHFLIQVKPPIDAKSNDGVSSFSRRNRLSDPQLLHRSMQRDTRI